MKMTEARQTRIPKSDRPTFFARWLSLTWISIRSWSTIIIFVLSFILAEVIWINVYGFGKAIEQAIENIIPTLAGAFITVIAIAIMQFNRANELIKSEDNKLQLITSNQADEANRLSNWLSQHLVHANIGISEAYLFGSVTHNYYATNDVDVVLIFRQMKEKEYVKKERGLTPITREFSKTFGKQLHFQRFLASESAKFQEFVAIQSEPILILQSIND